MLPVPVSNQYLSLLARCGLWPVRSAVVLVRVRARACVHSAQDGPKKLDSLFFRQCYSRKHLSPLTRDEVNTGCETSLGLTQLTGAHTSSHTRIMSPLSRAMGHGETSVDVAGPSIDERHRNLPARALLSDDSGKASALCRLTRELATLCRV